MMSPSFDKQGIKPYQHGAWHGFPVIKLSSIDFLSRNLMTFPTRSDVTV